MVRRLSKPMYGRSPIHSIATHRRSRHRFRWDFEVLESRFCMSATQPQQALPQASIGQTSPTQSMAYPQIALVEPTSGALPSGSRAPVGYVPAQIQTAYGFNQISFNGTPGDGRGETIAIVDAYDNPNIAGDLQAFDAEFGLPNPVFVKVAQDGSTNYPPTDPSRMWELETALDVEWAHAIAPGAAILLVEANSASDSDLFAAVDYAENQPGVVAVSMSWGEAENADELSDDANFVTPSGHSGVTFVASSGDTGSPENYPAISPNVLSVGGTTLELNSNNTWASESGWSGSGGGISLYEYKPSYQNSVNYVRQAGPDVAYDANPSTGVTVYDTFFNGASAPWIAVGGTSVGAPQWSGLIAIADQGRALNGLGSLDGAKDTLPLLYQMPASDFHDITTGNNGFSAGPGFDLVTGLGSPIANQVVAALADPATLYPSLAGTWFTNGTQQTSIQQVGTTLTFTNENGNSSPGTFLNDSQVVATGWGNLVGTLVPTADGVRIAWANGTNWDQLLLAGPAFIGSLETQVLQQGNSLTFINEFGDSSPGYISDVDHVVATGWGNLVGTLVPTFEGYNIAWANGTTWNMINLAGTWFINGDEPTQIQQNGTNLTLINENNASTAGVIVGAGQINAPDWGVSGTLVQTPFGVQINWSNGSTWSQPRLGGQWFIGTNLPTEVYQGDNTITLINENGQLSSAYLASSNQIVATTWGNLVGTLVTTSTGLQINWSNGSTWFE
jgi:hypothetical protein